MKITQDLQPKIDTAQTKRVNTSQPSQAFLSMVGQERDKLQGEQLTKFLNQIQAQGEKIAKFRSFKDLAKYKRMIHEFIDEAVKHGLTLKQSRSWDLAGGNRQLTLVEQIDEKLMNLTDQLLDQEKDSLDLLKVIGEIKGLLVNIYA
ncbi:MULTISPECIES: YaaR family protein [Allobacillus]|uniref:YaaR family protein n=1 Tax=Allobacillus halotolerans TaxID=570278 RepID=A0ABS6GNU2_9BACI|nr:MULTISPECIES: YaaR family protein [Allobacillus]MBU6080107.1 YaaR family protein [Allobacillus halotolerans]TSJ65440.1 DUF327 family protein [Allobacillus sp. SKP2-8]